MTVTSEEELGETVEKLIVFRPSGEPLEIPRDQILTFDLARLAVCWKTPDAKVHRCVGLPIEMIAVQNRIIRGV